MIPESTGKLDFYSGFIFLSLIDCFVSQFIVVIDLVCGPYGVLISPLVLT